VPVGFETQWPQFRPFRGGWAGVTHPSKPVNALWLRPEKTFDKPASPDGKVGHYLVVDGKPGDKIEETLYLHALVIPSDGHPPHGVSFSFHSTSLSIGKDFSKRAERLQVATNGHPLKGYVVGKWRLSSDYKKGDSGFGWFRPVLSLLGKLGEEHGPTRDQMLYAARLRADFKQVLTPALKIEGPPEPPEKPSPYLDGPLPSPPDFDGLDAGPDEGPDDEIGDIDFGP
jgi:hypothetical protein